MPLYKRAIELDSRFAVAHSGLAVSYYNLNQMGKASEEVRQAYEAGDRQTYREHLNIAALYYDLAQGDIKKAIEGCAPEIKDARAGGTGVRAPSRRGKSTENHG